EDHVVDMSVGYIIGDKIIVRDGPLKGKEGSIKKIDRHKRIAFIEVEFLGEVRETKVGLEIITKNI
ncbi:MAG: KOW motif-containing protein, partial [Carnobacterium sp.]